MRFTFLVVYLQTMWVKFTTCLPRCWIIQWPECHIKGDLISVNITAAYQPAVRWNGPDPWSVTAPPVVALEYLHNSDFQQRKEMKDIVSGRENWELGTLYLSVDMATSVFCMMTVVCESRDAWLRFHCKCPKVSLRELFILKIILCRVREIAYYFIRERWSVVTSSSILDKSFESFSCSIVIQKDVYCFSDWWFFYWYKFAWCTFII